MTRVIVDRCEVSDCCFVVDSSTQEACGGKPHSSSSSGKCEEECFDLLVFRAACRIVDSLWNRFFELGCSPSCSTSCCGLLVATCRCVMKGSKGVVRRHICKCLKGLFPDSIHKEKRGRNLSISLALQVCVLILPPRLCVPWLPTSPSVGRSVRVRLWPVRLCIGSHCRSL